MKNWGLRIVVIGCLVGVALWLRGRTPPPTPILEQSPDSAAPSTTAKADWSKASKTVNDFFQAASEGDDNAYLRLVDGQLRRSLEQTRSEVGVEEFRQSLRRSAAEIKGLAVTPGGDVSDNSVALDVEIVFADRNEYQRMMLARKGRSWVITSIEQARMVKPAVPYGTPVFEEIEEEKEEGSTP